MKPTKHGLPADVAEYLESRGWKLWNWSPGEWRWFYVDKDCVHKDGGRLWEEHLYEYKWRVRPGRDGG